MSKSMSYTSYFAPAYPAGMADGHVAVCPKRIPPTHEDWERHRPLIKQLYMDENKTLKVVAGILAAEYEHHATPRMYKGRIEKWKLDKNFKESDVVAILRKTTERNKARKQTTIRVRGRVVTMEEIQNYLKRKKKLRDLEAYNAPTPSDVSCRTPSPEPMERSFDKHRWLVSANDYVWSRHTGSLQPLPSSYEDAEIDDIDQTSAASINEDEYLLQLTICNMYSLASDDPIIPHSLVSPRSLLIPERLLLTIKTYMEGSFERGLWITDETGHCKSVSSFKNSAVPGDFFTYCYSAISLARNGSVVDFRRTLSKAFNLIKDLIQSEHPRTLETFLDMIILLKREGHPKVSHMLRKYVFELAIVVCTKEHPWTHIARLLAMLEEDTLEQAIIQSWRCNVESFERVLGSSHQTSLDANLFYIQYVEASASPVDAESLLRRLLTECEEVYGKSSPQTLHIVIKLGWNFINLERHKEAEELGLEGLSLAEEQNLDMEKILALELIAGSQYHQDKRSSAEKNQRNSVKMGSDAWGMSDAWSVNGMVILESWLRRWGREEEADDLKAEIDKALGPDEIHEEFSRMGI